MHANNRQPLTQGELQYALQHLGHRNEGGDSFLLFPPTDPNNVASVVCSGWVLFGGRGVGISRVIVPNFPLKCQIFEALSL